MTKLSIIFTHHRNEPKKQLARDLRRQMTRAEKIIWNQLRHHRLANLHFRRQVLIEPFIVDFYCPEKKLVIEIDGGVHMRQEGMDSERDKYLTALGLNILHIPNAVVFRDLAQAIQMIKSACQNHPTP